MFATINDVDLLFDGQYIYGDVVVNPGSFYSIRIAGDTDGDIGDSTFAAFNFGPDLEDSDGSAGHDIPFPNSLNLSEFEENEFLIWGTYVATGDEIRITGRLDTFSNVPEPTGPPIYVLGFFAFLRRQR